MKVHYINILLFALPLNILVNTHKKASITQNTQTNRSLCECELYAPVNYDNDPQMKQVMEIFHKQTQQRLSEYDERMKTTRQKCKDQCDKEIQKIILKDKLEKQMAEQFATLDTDIQSDAIPTCVCEKSIEDKVEKGCLRCAQNLGGIVAPSAGVLGEIAALAVKGWKNVALDVATKYAMKEGLAAGEAAGLKEGMRVIVGALQQNLYIDTLNGTPLQTFFTSTPYYDVKTIATAIDAHVNASCPVTPPVKKGICVFHVKPNLPTVTGERTGNQMDAITRGVKYFVGKATERANAEATEVSTATSSNIMEKQSAAIDAVVESSTASIYAPIIAIVVIVLIMVIIYLILRRRRKKKMKKKLQYIKLLEE
ncbi:rifin PIR protein,putative [Plasmodium sp. DRC-Itaito]|nr:rifin PIR protein,putative [Plasmodium sp. DRC-Itaito]